MPAPSLFNLNVDGPPPGDPTVTTTLWVDLGTVPSGLRIWIGGGTFTSPTKSLTFEIRTNNAGKSAGSDNDTAVMTSFSVSPRNGTVQKDFYRKGRLHITTVYGGSSEKWWLKLKGKGGTAAEYQYMINYTTE